MPTDVQLFFSTFTLIFLAELPDKTALATIVMATRMNPIAIFLGVAGAFLVQTIVAICFGGLLGLLPAQVVQVGAALLFFVFAWKEWRGGAEEEGQKAGAKENRGFWEVARAAFMVIFIAEWGDLTQLSTMALVAKYHRPFVIGGAAVLSLWAVTIVEIIIGHQSKRFLNPELLRKIAAAAFFIVGLVLLVKTFL